MADELDKMLDTYKVADADAPLLDRITAAAQRAAANENAAKAVWLRRSALLAMTAILGFWMGNVTQPSVRTLTSTTIAVQSAGSDQYYLDRMIMGPGSLNEIGL